MNLSGKYLSIDSQASPLTNFMITLFHNLNDNDIDYAVLRNYDNLPDDIGYDLDLLINDREALERVARDVAQQTGWELIKKEQRFEHLSLHFVCRSCSGLPLFHIDALSSSTWKGIEIIPGNVITRRKLHHKGFFYILPPGIEAAITLTKNLLFKNKVRNKYKLILGDMVRGDRTGFCQALEAAFYPEMVSTLAELTCKQDWVGVESLARQLRHQAILKAVKEKPFDQPIRWAFFVLSHLKRFFLFQGFFLVFIGPDGSGKSTVSEGVRRHLKSLFPASRYFHGHFRILPRLRDLAMRTKLVASNSAHDKIKFGPQADGRIVHFSRLRSLIYLLYYSLDYFLGHLVIFYCRGRGELIIFDRYYYDYLIQPRLSLPSWLTKTLIHLIPKPDAVVYLKNSPDIILSRKPELTRDELEWQSVVCHRVISLLRQGVIIETTGTPEETTIELSRVLVDHLLAGA